MTRDLESLLALDFGLSQDAIARAENYIQKHGGRLEKVLVSTGAISADMLPKLYESWLGLPMLPQHSLENMVDLVNFPLDQSYLLENGWFPFGYENDQWLLAAIDPIQPNILDYLSFNALSYKVYVCNESQLHLVHVKTTALSREKGSQSNYENDQLLELASEAPTVNFVNNIVYKAVRLGASDLHIETDDERGRVRNRIDGVLRDSDMIPKALVLPVVTRLKILSGLDIAEKRRPQDGKIEMLIGSEELDIRVSIMPKGSGESVVMRFLRKDALKPKMEELGMSIDIEQQIRKDLQKTTGVILLTGPTGSGKTTSLYTFLSYLNTPDVKIITLEDPIEYQLEGVNQVQVQPDIGFDFAAGLRSIVRQDPDIIMLGEIRDKETASIAMQSALTGHLVFSTVHTNDAASAFSRLLDLGVDEFLLNAALVSIIAQRLARKLCGHCSRVDPESEALIDRYNLKELAERFGIDNIKLHKPVGCEMCGYTGFKGRTALMEYLRCDESIQRLPKDADFVRKARLHLEESGSRSLLHDGLYKAMQGVTTISEVIRVAG